MAHQLGLLWGQETLESRAPQPTARAERKAVRGGGPACTQTQRFLSPPSRLEDTGKPPLPPPCPAPWPTLPLPGEPSYPLGRWPAAHLQEKLNQAQVIGLLPTAELQQAVDARFQKQSVIDGIQTYAWLAGARRKTRPRSRPL